jgi:hypothetical protein
VHAWLLRNPVLVTLGLAAYIVVFAITYDAQKRVQKSRFQAALKGASIRPPRLMLGRNKPVLGSVKRSKQGD